MNDKQDLLLDQLNILCLIWHALKIVSAGHFNTQRRKNDEPIILFANGIFLQIMVAMVFYILIIVCNF